MFYLNNQLKSKQSDLNVESGCIDVLKALRLSSVKLLFL